MPAMKTPEYLSTIARDLTAIKAGKVTEYRVCGEFEIRDTVSNRLFGAYTAVRHSAGNVYLVDAKGATYYVSGVMPTTNWAQVCTVRKHGADFDCFTVLVRTADNNVGYYGKI